MKPPMLTRLGGALICAALQWAAPPPLAAQDAPPIRSPVSPRESLQHIVVPPGLMVELVAHEPSIIDPVAIRFDEDGRMWVVEMRDYPTGSAGGKGGSRISILEDADNDGLFETATVFADDLKFATGIQPWKGGAFVTMAGQLAYLKDTSGDGKADLVETWYTGFAEENTQLRANHPRLALDNHIYVANGLRGGTIVDARRADPSPSPSPKRGAVGGGVSISGMDFRFDPHRGEFEAVSGVGQFGLSFDDYGNRFVSTNRNPAIHVVLEDRHLKKNRLLAVPAVANDVAKAGEQSSVFPITRAWTTSHLHAGQFTAACGLEVYRGDALPAEFCGNVFVCEPTGHLVHRERLKPRGVTFTSTPAYDGREFFASRDAWCSPVNLEVGPDGALYVVDMYRAVIEHPEWMPTELRERPDLLEGNDRGRIYRVVPSNFRRPSRPNLSSAPSQTLVKLLAHPNAWWRETAARLLLERQDKSVQMRLELIAAHHESHLARIHALWLLEGLGLLSDDAIMQALSDESPHVVEQAILVAEPRLTDEQELRETIAKLVAHKNPRLRFQALLAATPPPRAPVTPADRWEVVAMLVATRNRGGQVLSQMVADSQNLAKNVPDPRRFVAELARLAAASNDDRQIALAIDALLANAEYGRAGLASLLGEFRRPGPSLEKFLAKLDKNARRRLDQAFADARRDATDRQLPDSTRGEAVDLLAVAPNAAETLLHIAVDEVSQPVRLRAVTALAKRDDLTPWRKLLEHFSSQSPAMQRAILDGLFARPERTALLLDVIAAGRIRTTELDSARINLLLNHRDAEIKRHAETLFVNAVPTDRAQALADYQVVLSMKANAARGRGVFEKQCATCHRVAGVGIDVAPDISDSREKTPEQLLTDILQPNRAIDANYFSYTAITDDGLVHTGILTAETSTSVTLRQQEGKTITLRRDQIDALHSNGVSLMPDGMEKLIPPQDMADLISFIKNWRYLDDATPLPLNAR